MSHPTHNTNEVTASERRWVFYFGMLVMLTTTIPYILGYARQGDAWQFTGFVFGVEDGNSYIAKMLSGSNGAWFFKTPYTTSYQPGVIAFLPYLVLGKLALAPGIHEQLVVFYHLFRIVSGMLAILATYDFISMFLNEIMFRRMGLALSILGGGLGWIAVLIGSSSLPLEFYSPETFGFLSLFGIPHLALARATFLWSLVIYLRFVVSEGSPWWRQSCRLGILWLLTAIAQPITAIVLGIVIGLHCMVSGAWQFWRRQMGIAPDSRRWYQILRMVTASFVFPAPFLLYYFLSFSLDPFLKMWTSQNLIPSPQPVQYLLAYGLILPFALSGAIRLFRSNTWKGLFLTSWVLALPFLAYAPFNLQRRLPEGMWVALVTLAMVGLEGWHGQDPIYSNHRSRHWLRSGWVLLLVLPSTLILVFGGILTTMKPSIPVFRTVDEIQAFDYLINSATEGDIVLASFDTSNALPAWVPLRVVIGHGPESVGLSSLRPQVEAFFSTETHDEARVHFLKEYHVRYVIRGPLERRLGQWDPGVAPYLKEIYKIGEFEIYEILPESPS